VPGPKTNERPGTRAVLRYVRVSPYKVREVLDLIRGKPVAEAAEILRFSQRDAATLVGKLLASAVANAENNDEQEADDLYVSACFADEGTTIKRWRPRARGRATRIRKRTSHVTIIVSRLPDDQLARIRARREAEQIARRARRVAGARRTRRAGPEAPAAAGVAEAAEAAIEAATAADVAEEEGIVDQQAAAVAVAEAEEALEEAPPPDAESDAEAVAAESAESGAAEPSVAEAAEAEGVVDQQAVAAEQAEEPPAEPAPGHEQDEGEE
jgi:large subunit ribosomal protein L22